jgi:hypothetical protein
MEKDNLGDGDFNGRKILNGSLRNKIWESELDQTGFWYDAMTPSTLAN